MAHTAFNSLLDFAVLINREYWDTMVAAFNSLLDFARLKEAQFTMMTNFQFLVGFCDVWYSDEKEEYTGSFQFLVGFCKSVVLRAYNDSVVFQFLVGFCPASLLRSLPSLIHFQFLVGFCDIGNSSSSYNMSLSIPCWILRTRHY